MIAAVALKRKFKRQVVSKGQYSILMHIYMEFRKTVMITLYAIQEKKHKCTERTASKHVYYQV